MLIFPGEIHDLRDLGLRHLVREDAALADPMIVDMEHDARSVLLVFLEEPHDDVHDEFHRRVIIVHQQDTVETRLFGLRARLGDDRRAAACLSLAASFGIPCHAAYRTTPQAVHLGGRGLLVRAVYAAQSVP